MEWFEGTATEAVAQVQRRGTGLLVFVTDGKEASDTVEQAMAQGPVAETVKKNDFVAVKLTAWTPDAINFAQAYPVLVTPTLYFITAKGAIASALAGPQTADNIVNALAKLAGTPGVPLTSSAPPAGTSQGQQDVQSQACQTGEAVSVAEAEPTEAGLLPDNVGMEPAGVGKDDQREHDTAEVAACSRPLDGAGAENVTNGQLANSRAAPIARNVHPPDGKASSSASCGQPESQRPLPRKEGDKNGDKQQQGSNSAEYRRRLEEIEQAEREEKASRKRIKEMIENDRRQVRGDQPSRSTAVKNADSAQGSGSSTALPSQRAVPTTTSIRYRLPDGSTVKLQHESEMTLGQARDQLLTTVDGLGEGVRLLFGFPPQPFEPDDYDATLAALHLVPSAAIIVKRPKGGTSLQLQRSTNWVLEWVMTVFSQLPVRLNPFYYLGWYTPPQYAQADTATQSRPERQSRADGAGSSNAEQPRAPTVRRVTRTIHGLHDNDGSDRTETWNGNSTTQQ